MEEEFLPGPEMEGEPVDVQPAGIPDLDPTGTSYQGDPFSMIAPGAADPESEVTADVIQAYQEDLLTRAIEFVTDERASKGSPSPADSIMQALNVRGKPVPENIGAAAAEVIMLLTSNAKRQGVEYPSESVLGSGVELVQILMDIARDGGVAPDIPQDEDDPAYQQMAEAAALEATKAYGERMVATGQVSQEEFAQQLQEMMEDEAATGELDDWDPMESMTPDAMKNLINRGVGLAQQFTAEQFQQPAEPPAQQPTEG